jgi:hypothetical protein
MPMHQFTGICLCMATEVPGVKNIVGREAEPGAATGRAPSSRLVEFQSRFGPCATGVAADVVEA